MKVFNFSFSANLTKIIRNTVWLLSERILRLCLNLFVGIWVARYLGSEAFGLFNYAIAYVGLFGTFSTLGLDQIVVRDIVRESEQQQQLMGTTFVLKLMGAIAAFILATTTISLLRPQDAFSHQLVLIASISLLFQAFDVIDFWFQSQMQVKYTALAKNTALVLMSLAKLLCIYFKLPLEAFVWIYTSELGITALGLIIFYLRQGLTLTAWRSSFKCGVRLLQDSWTLILTSFMIAIYVRTDQLMLGQMIDDRAVGIYSVAVRISELWYFIPITALNSVYPKIIEAKQISEALYYQRLEKVFTLVSLVSYAAAIVTSFTARLIVQILFGPEYGAASSILIVHVWTGLFVSLGVVRGAWTTIEGLMQFAFITTAIGALVNVLFNIWLIPLYGGMGAAIATVIAQVFASYLAGVFFPETRRIFWAQTKALLPNPAILWNRGS